MKEWNGLTRTLGTRAPHTCLRASSRVLPAWRPSELPGFWSEDERRCNMASDTSKGLKKIGFQLPDKSQLACDVRQETALFCSILFLIKMKACLISPRTEILCGSGKPILVTCPPSWNRIFTELDIIKPCLCYYWNLSNPPLPQGAPHPGPVKPQWLVPEDRNCAHQFIPACQDSSHRLLPSRCKTH